MDDKHNASADEITSDDCGAPIQSPTDNAKALYDYVLMVYQEYRGSRDYLRDHVHKTINKLLAAFVGVGAGLAALVALLNATPPEWLVWLSMTFGSLAIISIAISLTICAILFQFEESPLPGAKGMDEVLQFEGFHDYPHADTVNLMTGNILSAYEEFSQKAKKVGRYAWLLNWCMLASLLLTILFLVTTGIARLWVL